MSSDFVAEVELGVTVDGTDCQEDVDSKEICFAIQDPEVLEDEFTARTAHDAESLRGTEY